MKLPDNVYEILKWLSCIALDAIGMLYKTLANIWGLPFGDQVYDTFVAVSVCLGVLIGVSTYTFKKENSIIIEPKESEETEE